MYCAEHATARGSGAWPPGKFGKINILRLNLIAFQYKINAGSTHI